MNKAFLVSVYPSGVEKQTCEEYIKELSLLCESYGLEVVGSIIAPLRKIDVRIFIGQGKLEEISVLAAEADLIVFDDEISPHQQKNLEAFLKKPVMDRTELIIGVFAKGARSKEAKAQVELAQIRYQFPRLKRMWTHLSRQSGGGHVKGEGEKQIEIDRRLLRKRIEILKKEIEEVKEHRATQRASRKRSQIPTFAIIGYTNAGKSTLLNALTDAGAFVENKLFATLDTMSRRFILPNNQEILLVDTVGFIRKLPHTLVAAFRSTLEEAIDTDILIHLIDASHPQVEDHIQATEEVLKQLQAEKKPMIVVLNKIDNCQNPFILTKLKMLLPKVVMISALHREGFPDLISRLTEEIANLRRSFKIKIPQSNYVLVSEIMRDGIVLSSEYEDNDIILNVEVPAILEHKLVSYKIEDV